MGIYIVLLLGILFSRADAALKISLSAEIYDGPPYPCHQDLSDDYICDPYAEPMYSDWPPFYYRMGKTSHLIDNHSPVWTEVYTIPNEAVALRFEVWDYDPSPPDDYLGYNSCSINTLLNAPNGTLYLELVDPYGMGQKFGILAVHVVERPETD